MIRGIAVLAAAAALALPVAIAQAQAFGAGSEGFSFAGFDWTVKRSDGPTAPQNNRFGGLGSNVILLPDGSLALRVAPDADGVWRSAEVVLSRSLGYGTYRFRLASRLDRFDDAIVAGLFTWDTAPSEAHRELDIEFSTWGGRTRGMNAQYVVQPHSDPERIRRFVIAQEGDYTSHELRWMEGSVEFASWHGHGRRPERGSPLLSQEWSYSAKGVPSAGKERVHLNLYLLGGQPPLNGKPVELIVSDFQFEPEEDHRR